MAYLNENYLKLQAGYLFPEIARRVREFCEKNPDGAKRLIRCGIGDVTEPLPQAAIDAIKRAADELGHRETFRGYGPEQGYDFLRSTIAQDDFRDPGSKLVSWRYRDIVVLLGSEDAVRGVSITGPKLVTSRGLPVGDPIARMKSLYGTPTFQDDAIAEYAASEEQRLHVIRVLLRGGLVKEIFLGWLLD